LFDKLRADFAMYDAPLREPGFWITATYRIGHWARHHPSVLVRMLGRPGYGALALPVRLFRNVYLPSNAEIGGGLRLAHPSNIYVPPNTRIGRGVSLYHDVTLGTGPQPGTPSVGDRCMIFAGARLVGGIQIGDDVHVGTNAVVNKDVPDGSTVFAPVSRVVPRDMAARIRR
jgi:serine acetyltransferase